ncbi:hypothetical protein ACFR9U_09960 [Halorientalis brevis]|uniref:Uncharacterized protein n=1 Tax=Halorientalis brevis TaxID=1126241 RepID=A0ABD6CBS6_9EURY|nr:hypothetical protein [Halorientalis brevis]
MPLVPHYPSDEPDDGEVPDLTDVVDRIIHGDSGDHPVVTTA